MTGISARMQFLVRFVRIPPEMWDVIVPQGPILSIASREYMMAGVVRDIGKSVADKKVQQLIYSAGKEMASFAAKNLLAGWEEGDDICPPWPWPWHFPRPHWPWPWPWPGPDPGPDPDPYPWRGADLAALNPQPLPPQYLSSALKVLAGLTSVKGVGDQLQKAADALGRM